MVVFWRCYLQRERQMKQCFSKSMVMFWSWQESFRVNSCMVFLHGKHGNFCVMGLCLLECRTGNSKACVRRWNFTGNVRAEENICATTARWGGTTRTGVVVQNTSRSLSWSMQQQRQWFRLLQRPVGPYRWWLGRAGRCSRRRCLDSRSALRSHCKRRMRWKRPSRTGLWVFCWIAWECWRRKIVCCGWWSNRFLWLMRRHLMWTVWKRLNRLQCDNETSCCGRQKQCWSLGWICRSLSVMLLWMRLQRRRSSAGRFKKSLVACASREACGWGK